MLSTIPKIRPVSDLRNKFAEISREVHESDEPVVLTKNGYADMIVWSVEAFEQEQQKLWEQYVVVKLKEAELEAKTNPVRYDADDVFAELDEIIAVKAIDNV